MDGKQIINCTVKSCEYNNSKTKMCELKDIVVTPCKKCGNGNKEDESMCGNYRCK